jgi:hypothetical protein
MKKFSPMFILSGILFTACFNTQQTQESTCVVKWQLAEMTGNMANVPPLKGETMSWQESYTLQPDSTFTKQRQSDKQWVATGRYKIVNMGDEQFIELSYDAPSEIIGSCLGADKEILRLLDGKLYGTWQACDGPGLTYERMTVNCED